MMAEIVARGPIVCLVGVNQEFLDYKAGDPVFRGGTTAVNHAIYLSGYGVTDDGVKYWNLRNSWGNYWGEAGGSMRILRGANTAAVESSCTWGVPAKPRMYYGN